MFRKKRKATFISIDPFNCIPACAWKVAYSNSSKVNLLLKEETRNGDIRLGN